MAGSGNTTVTVASLYHRSQFDDWLAGGEIEYGGRRYQWAAQDSGYGFGWEIEPVAAEEWAGVSATEFDRIVTLVEGCLRKHRTAYAF